MRVFFIALALALVSLARPAGASEKRVALVIGVGAYRNAPALPNPENDARLIGPLLQKLGFNTDIVLDPDRSDMEDAVRRFGRRIEGASATLFFYAGHGIQVASRNYLLPIDARIQVPDDLRWEALDVQTVLDEISAPNRVNLVFLDACRDNPFALSLAARMGTRSTLVGRGLAREDRPPSGTLIAYATDPGQVALDGTGGNSPFSAALAKYIAAPGLEIDQIMKRVNNEVAEATNDRQHPWGLSNLRA